jgi:uncharacterized membrane protein YbaN (DUF454 family)
MNGWMIFVLGIVTGLVLGILGTMVWLVVSMAAAARSEYDR